MPEVGTPFWWSLPEGDRRRLDRGPSVPSPEETGRLDMIGGVEEEVRDSVEG